MSAGVGAVKEDGEEDEIFDFQGSNRSRAYFVRFLGRQFRPYTTELVSSCVGADISI